MLEIVKKYNLLVHARILLNVEGDIEDQRRTFISIAGVRSRLLGRLKSALFKT